MDFPSAADDSALTLVDTGTSIDVLANDAVGGGPGPLEITEVGTPTHGSAAAGPSNLIVYTPSNGFVGGDSFTYTVSDGLDTATATVSVSVYPNSDVVWLPLDESDGFVVRNALGRAFGSLTNFTGTARVAGHFGNIPTVTN